MRHRVTTIITTAIALAAVAGNLDAQEATLTIVGAPDIVGPSAALDVTPDGQFVVGTTNGAVFRWSEAGGVEILSPADWLHTHTAGVSDDGTQVTSTLWHDDIQLYSPSRWTEGQGWEALGGLPGEIPPDGSHGSGYDISGDGSVVVGLGWTTEYKAEGFAWTQATGVYGLGYPVTASSRATNVSADGRVITGFYEHESFGNRRPVRWVDSGPPDLFLGADTFGEATGVSTDGRLLTGTVGWNGVDQYSYCFAYDADRGTSTRLYPVLDTPSHWTFCSGIADSGVTVGWSGTQTGGNVQAAIWFPGDERMRYLADYLAGFGVTVPADWLLVSALAVTPDGRFVVGQAAELVPPYNYGAFIATIPATTIFEDGFETGDLVRWN